MIRKDRCEVLSQCRTTTVKNELLYDLLTGNAKAHVPGAVCLLDNGHSRGDAARQIMCYILRRALGVVRLPGTYDIQLRQSHFEHLDPDALEAAVAEAKRIYAHTQSELLRVWGEEPIAVKRGVRFRESAAIRFLLDKLEGDTAPFYLGSLSFFNYKSGTFVGDFDVTLDCPLEWIWASKYTLKMDRNNSCEEFIVVCTDPTGLVELPRSAFRSATTAHPHEPLKVNGLRSEKRRDVIGHALATLAHVGFEPDDTNRYNLKYSPGKWETRFRRWADRLIQTGQKWDSSTKNGRAQVRRDLDWPDSRL